MRQSKKDREEWEEERTALERKLHTRQERILELGRLTRSLHRQLDATEADLSLALKIQTDKRRPAPIKRRRRRKNECTALICCSDWHVGETVLPGSINDIGPGYNPDIAKRRATKFWQNAVTLVEQARAHNRVDTIIVWLGGDLITGYESAPELVEHNSMGPIEEVLFARQLIRGGIDYLLAELKPKRLIIPCNMGNHGRIGVQGSSKLRYSTQKGTSLEFALYHILAGDFDGDKRVEFDIAEGMICYLPLYNLGPIRFMHGDGGVRSRGGAAGLYGGLANGITRLDRDRLACLTVIGHFHQVLDLAGKVDGTGAGIVNGSLIGPSAYSTRFGFYDAPRQAFALLDSRRGKLYTQSIWVE